MNEARCNVVQTIRVLEEGRREDGKEIRSVLFSRSSDGGVIEIRAETDTPNLLAGMEAISSLVDRMLAGEEALPAGGGVRLIGMTYRAVRADAPMVRPRRRAGLAHVRARA
jgi:hypothetical protein